MSAAIVPSGIAFGVMLMPANPASPFRPVKVDRYAPGGGSRLVGDVGEEQALLNAVQSMSETMRVEPSTDTSVAHTGGWTVWVSMVFLVFS